MAQRSYITGYFITKLFGTSKYAFSPQCPSSHLGGRHSRWTWSNAIFSAMAGAQRSGAPLEPSGRSGDFQRRTSFFTAACVSRQIVFRSRVRMFLRRLYLHTLFTRAERAVGGTSSDDVQTAMSHEARQANFVNRKAACSIQIHAACARKRRPWLPR